jgi:hypothetical protein
MSQMGLLFVISEPPAAMEEELNEWYDREHIPERLAIKGFVSALRFVSVVRPHRYLALYDLTHVGVLHTDEYMTFAGANFTPWTKRVVSRAKFTRAETVQMSPGDASTATAPKLLVLRFSGVGSEKDALIAEGAKHCFAEGRGVSQLRLFAGRGEQADLRFIIVAGAGDLEALVDPEAFGAAIAHLDLVETFVPC